MNEEVRMEGKYFFLVNNQRGGPVSLAELRALATRGELKRTDRIWKDGMGAWAAAEAVSGLFEGLPPDLDSDDREAAGPESAFNMAPPDDDVKGTSPRFMRQERQVFIIAWPAALLFGFLSFCASDTREPALTFTTCSCAALGIAFLGLGFFKWMQMHYRLWRLVPAEIASTTPGKAIGFFFIPLFNIVWMFVTFNALAKDTNKTLEKLRIRDYRCNEGLALGFSIVQACQYSFASMFPLLPLILLVASYALWIAFYADLCRAFELIEKHPANKPHSPLLSNLPN